jgi:hypothetical protein
MKARHREGVNQRQRDDVYQGQIAVCDQQIQECLAQLPEQLDLLESPIPPPKHLRHKPQGNEPAFDLRTHLYRISGVDFTQIDGFGVLPAQQSVLIPGL